jgi:DNA-binding HxlR family transcriptional regulator
MDPCTCGVSKTLKVIGSKWTILILHDLFEGKKRFGELLKSQKGISPKTLSIRLQELERFGIVKKKVFAEIPLHVEYSLTKKGQSLNEIICKMREWGECHEVKIKEVKPQYVSG